MNIYEHPAIVKLMLCLTVYKKLGIVLVLGLTLAQAQPADSSPDIPFDIPRAATLKPSEFRYCNYKPSESALHRLFENRAVAFARRLYSLQPNYRGSVLEVATGKRLQASGTIHAEFVWEACSWHIEDYRYTTKP